MVITNNLQQASFRLRILAPRDLLQSRGIDLDIQLRPRSFFPRRNLLRRADQYDAVILQRKLLDPIDIRLLKSTAKKLFYDVDDAVMFHSHPVGPIERWRTQRRFRSVARAVDTVVAGNDYLAGLFRAAGANAVVLPTVVDPAHYMQKSHAPTTAPTLVWIGSKSTLRYLADFTPTLAQAAAQIPGLRLVTIADATLLDPPIPTEHIPWSEQTESSSLIRADIGIAPTPNDPWTLGKCGFKIIQYVAAGLPAIASPVGANRQIILQNETGILADTANEWISALATLAADPAKRQAMGAAGRKRVEDQFSIQRAADFWRAILTA
jgi:glycosyltransferase involved in cell wall biosynthesis